MVASSSSIRRCESVPSNSWIRRRRKRRYSRTSSGVRFRVSSFTMKYGTILYTTSPGPVLFTPGRERIRQDESRGGGNGGPTHTPAGSSPSSLVRSEVDAGLLDAPGGRCGGKWTAVQVFPLADRVGANAWGGSGPGAQEKARGSRHA